MTINARFRDLCCINIIIIYDANNVRSVGGLRASGDPQLLRTTRFKRLLPHSEYHIYYTILKHYNSTTVVVHYLATIFVVTGGVFSYPCRLVSRYVYAASWWGQSGVIIYFSTLHTWVITHGNKGSRNKTWTTTTKKREEITE